MRKIMFVFSLFVWSLLTAQYRPSIQINKDARLQKLQDRIYNGTMMRPANISETVYMFEDFNGGSIPSGWTVIDSAGTGAVWNVVTDRSGSSLDGTSFVIADSDGVGGVDMDTYLVSPVISGWNSGDIVYLTFDQFFYYYSGNEIGDVDVFDGTTWVNLIRYQGRDVGSWDSPDHPRIDLTPYLNPDLKIRFHYYNAHYDWYWAVDNVKIFKPNNDDLSIQWIHPWGWLDGPVPFSVIIKNSGASVQNNFDIIVAVQSDTSSTHTIYYSDTLHITGANLGPDDDAKYNFNPVWTPPADTTYWVDFQVILPTDQNLSDNGFRYVMEIYSNYAYQAGNVYSHVSYDADGNGDLNHLVKIPLNTGVPIDIDSVSGFYGDYTTSGTFSNAGDLMFAADNYNIFYFVDSTAGFHAVNYPYDLYEGVNGITMDRAPSASELYVIAENRLLAYNMFFDRRDIGLIPDTLLMIGLAMDNNGTLYGLDLVTDALYTIDTSNAGVNLVGPLNLPLRYAQDIGYDAVNDKIYGTLFLDDNGNYSSGLYEINKTDGTPTLIGSALADEYTLCAVLGGSLKIEKLNDSTWKMFPNPVKNSLQIESEADIKAVNIYDTQGKLVRSVLGEGKQMRVDVRMLPHGNYILKLITGEGRGTKLFIKK